MDGSRPEFGRMGPAARTGAAHCDAVEKPAGVAMGGGSDSNFILSAGGGVRPVDTTMEDGSLAISAAGVPGFEGCVFDEVCSPLFVCMRCVRGVHFGKRYGIGCSVSQYGWIAPLRVCVYACPPERPKARPPPIRGLDGLTDCSYVLMCCTCDADDT